MVPENLQHVHLMGICGAGMASLAGILKARGFKVTGSDQDMYPPMSSFLGSLFITVFDGYRAGNLHPPPDLVIVGNVVTKDNPEAVELSSLGLPYLSFPQALMHFAVKGKRPIVIAGTHGKTTTSSLVAWILEKAGLDPGFMIGGIPKNFEKGFKVAGGPDFVIEGDEYDTAFFDKGPKFFHYCPEILVLTSIEFDHADIYEDLYSVVMSFRKMISLVPPSGLIIGNSDDPVVREETKRAQCLVQEYSLKGNAEWGAKEVQAFPAEESGEIRQQNEETGYLTDIRIFRDSKEFMSLLSPLYGRHNLGNLLSSVILADFIGIPQEIISEAVRTFKGVKRRQEIVGEKKGVLIVDDFAHHPTSVRETIEAVKRRYNGRRLIAVFEPRSNSSRRSVFQGSYALCFDQADIVMIPPPPGTKNIPREHRFSSERLVADLRNRRLEARYFENTGGLLEELISEAKTGDVILFMSNGAFDDLPRRMLDRL